MDSMAERIIRKRTFLNYGLPVKKRVAAYARVSSGKDAMMHSLSTQISCYSEMIQKNLLWEFAGVYADEAITGTKGDRPELQKLLIECRAGRVDIIITKSISRLARNTVTMLETVRELKALNVDVFFERENIHSMSGDGELMLTILSSFAQEESRSVSENCKWRIRKMFEEGRASCATMLGYRLVDGTLQIVPDEAIIVKQIFSDFISGMGRIAIAESLNKAGVMTRSGGEWRESTIISILRNEKYTGCLLLQKTYRQDHLSKRKRFNQGELPMYFVDDCHEAIIDKDTFNKVQHIMKNRARKYRPVACRPPHYPFSSKMVCSICGKHYRRKTIGARMSKIVWICSTFNSKGKTACPSRQIPEDILMAETVKVLEIDKFDEATFYQKIDKIDVIAPDKLIFHFCNGKTTSATWKYSKDRRKTTCP